MPIYEFQCERCKKISSFLSLKVSEPVDAYCKFCGSKDVRKIISRVSILKSEEKRIESILDPSKFSDLDENDPRSIEKFVRRMGKEFGEDLGDDFEESFEEALEEAKRSEESSEEESP